MQTKKEKLEDFKAAISSTVRSISNSEKVEVIFGNQISKSSKNSFNLPNIENNVISSIDGATALKLDEKYEVSNENNLSINNELDQTSEMFHKENAEDNLISENVTSGISIENASYIENNVDNQCRQSARTDSALMTGTNYQIHLCSSSIINSSLN